MLRTLLEMLNDESALARVRESYNGLKKAYSNVFAGFEEVEGENAYAMVLNVPESLTSADVNVEYDDETNAVTVETTYNRGPVNYRMSATETLPDDADVDTMTATVVNGVFTLVVDKVEEAPEEEVAEEVNPVVVTIKRKNRK